MNQTDAMARAARAKKVTWVGFWVNVVLSVAKIIAGIVGRSGAMIADGVHSISDFVTDIIVIVFIGVSAKGENTRFRYGHGKFETFATMLISFYSRASIKFDTTEIETAAETRVTAARLADILKPVLSN